MSWPDLACAFGGGRQQQLVALRGDEVDLDLDLFLLAPLLDQLFGRAVGVRHPVIPEADRQLARRIGAAHERCGDRGGRQRGRTGHETTTTDFPRNHTIPPVRRPFDRLTLRSRCRELMALS